MHFTLSEAGLMMLTHELWAIQRPDRKNEGADLKRLTATTTHLFKQATKVAKQHLSKEVFQNHVTTFSQLMTSLHAKIKKNHRNIAIVLTIAAVTLVGVSLLIGSYWMLSIPAVLILVACVIARPKVRSENRLIEERTPSLKPMAKPTMAASSNEVQKTHEQVLSVFRNASVGANKNGPPLTILFPGSAPHHYQHIVVKGNNEIQEQQAKELQEKLLLFTENRETEKLQAMFTNLLALHAFEVVEEEIDYIFEKLVNGKNVGGNNQSRKTIIKINQAQIESHIHQLYDLSNIGSAKTYVVGTLKRTIPLSVMQTPHSKITEPLLNGCLCTAQYSQPFTSWETANAELQMVFQSTLKSFSEDEGR